MDDQQRLLDAGTFSESGVGELYVWERVGIASRRLGGDRGDWQGWEFSVYRGG